MTPDLTQAYRDRFEALESADREQRQSIEQVRSQLFWMLVMELLTLMAMLGNLAVTLRK